MLLTLWSIHSDVLLLDRHIHRETHNIVLLPQPGHPHRRQRQLPHDIHIDDNINFHMMKQERAAPGSAGTIGSALQRVQCWEVKNKSIYKNCMGWGQEGDILPVPGEQELRPSRPGVGYADVCLLVGGKGGGVCGVW